MIAPAIKATAAQREHEARQLCWTVAAVAFGGAPHFLAVPAWISLLVLLIGGWRITAALHGWRLPSLWLRLPVTVLGFSAVLLTYRSISGVEAGSALLLIMAAMKLLETRAERDRVLVVFIGYFLLFAVFLREQAIWSFGWLVLAAVGITAALVQTVRRERLLPAADATALAGRLLLQALPLALLLFVLFPRVPGPFWSMPPAARTGLSGLGEEMSPGDITQLSLSDEVAFRVRFDGAAPDVAALYWRGPVLERFDGQRWTALPLPAQRTAASPSQYETWGAQFDYQLVLEPHGRRWLLALENPLLWSLQSASLSPALQLISDEPVRERMAYRARSVASGSGAREAEEFRLALNLRLPQARNPRALALAERLRGETDSDRAFLSAILRYFEGGGFTYTLNPPRLDADTVDDFLFSARAGFCEHYASALAFLLRAGKVPARVVVGYQGGERNTLGDYWIVRQANAHAWVEAWLDGAWRRVDPTAVVAPQRIAQGYAETLADTSRVTGRLWRSNPYINRLTLSWDAVNAAWDAWVLAYGPAMQDELLLALGFDAPDTAQLAWLVSGATALCLLLMALLLGYRQDIEQNQPARLYAKLCRRLAHVVRERKPAEAPEHYARAVARSRPDLAAPVEHITALYLQLRYGGDPDPQQLRQLELAVRQFRPKRMPAGT